jgi:hypothetical protein
MFLHFLFGVQVYRAFQTFLWLPVASLAILHFTIQRKMMIEVWKAHNHEIYMLYEVYFNSERNRCYSRYYFFVFVMVIFMYQLFSADSFLVVFFGSLWVPQIFEYRKAASSLQPQESYRLSPGYVIFTTLHFVFFPSYLRLCPINVF